MSPTTTAAALGIPTHVMALASCCAPVAGEVMTVGQAETLATALKAVADPVRLRLISLVTARPAKPASAI